MSLYGYVGGDPVNFVDPSGLMPERGCLWGGSDCAIGLDGISTLDFNWDNHFSRLWVGGTGSGFGRRGGIDPITSREIRAFENGIRRGYEALRSKVNSLAEAQIFSYDCGSRALETGVSLAGDFAFVFGGSVAAGGAKAALAARALPKIGRGRKRLQQIKAGRAVATHGAGIMAVEWVGDATLTFGLSGASGTLSKAAATASPWESFDITSQGLTVYDFIPVIGTGRSAVFAANACFGSHEP